MSLATRCTACGTIFRVVQDQLRVSEGWVRCGRCAEVFDAREQLFDMDREAPPPWPAQPDAATEAMASPTPDSGQALYEPPAQETAPEALISRDEHFTEGPDQSTWVVPRDIEPEHEHIEIDAGPGLDDFAVDGESGMPQRHEPAWRDEPGTDLPDAAHAEPSLDAPADDAAEVQVDERLAGTAAMQSVGHTDRAAARDARPDPADVGFLTAAAGAARWQRPGIRLALSASTLLLTLLLGFQFVWHFRDALQAIYPPSAPALRAMCQATGCELQPWRRIDALSVDNSSLTQVGTAGNHYKLSIQLRNKAGYALALPWVDVSLTDASGALVSRRMLGPTDFAAGNMQIEARSERALQIVFSTDAQKVSGYSVEIFQP